MASRKIPDCLETGDIILFDYISPHWSFTTIISDIIKYFTHSKYSHVGMVVVDPEFGPVPLKGYYLLESTGLEPVPDAENGQVKFGIQLRALQEIIDNYEGKIFYRKVKVERTDELERKLACAHSVAHNRPYDDGFDYIKAAFDWQVGNLQRVDAFFCSALVSYLAVSLGWLPDTTPWTIVTPKDLGTEPRQRKDIVLQWLVPIDPEIEF